MDVRTLLTRLPPTRWFGDRIVGDRAAENPLPRRAWLLLALVAFALVPRVLMAWKLDTVCPDAILYIHSAEALAEGNLSAAFFEVNLNTLPLILLGLHKLGLDWVVAGQIWSVVLSTAVVLPLFGYLRRQFDDQVATIACAIYALHPRLVEWSGEIIRDPTFWFLATLSLYLMWRAVTEVRWYWFTATGLALLAASLTRVEGLFLFIPFVLWSIRRAWHVPHERARVATGLVLSLSIGPLVVLAVNLVLLQNFDQFQAVRTTPLKVAKHWTETMLGQAGDAAEDDPIAQAASAATPLAQRSWQYVNLLERGLTPLYLFFLVLGLWYWRRDWTQTYQWPLWTVAALVLAGIWVHLWCTQKASTRYPMLIVIVTLPWAALGLLALSRGCQKRFDVTRFGAWVHNAWIIWFLANSTLIGWGDALCSSYETRRGRAELGKWIRQEYGPEIVVMGPERLQRLVAYYAGTPYVAVAEELSEAELLASVDAARPDLLLVLPPDDDLGQYACLNERFREPEVRKCYESRHAASVVVFECSDAARQRRAKRAGGTVLR